MLAHRHPGAWAALGAEITSAAWVADVLIPLVVTIVSAAVGGYLVLRQMRQEREQAAEDRREERIRAAEDRRIQAVHDLGLAVAELANELGYESGREHVPTAQSWGRAYRAFRTALARADATQGVRPLEPDEDAAVVELDILKELPSHLDASMRRCFDLLARAIGVDDIEIQHNLFEETFHEPASILAYVSWTLMGYEGGPEVLGDYAIGELSAAGKQWPYVRYEAHRFRPVLADPLASQFNEFLRDPRQMYDEGREERLWKAGMELLFPGPAEDGQGGARR